ncbi:MAG: hypothetical protein ACUVQP_00085 [Bacteroidales bacterium]
MPNYQYAIPPENPNLIQGLKDAIESSLKFYRENQNDIDAILTATDVAPYLKGAKLVGESLAFLPLIGMRNPRARELYIRKFGLRLTPNKELVVMRRQLEPGPNLVSHPSRGGIFVTTPENFVQTSILAPQNTVDRTIAVSKKVKLSNPVVIPAIRNRDYLVSGVTMSRKFEKMLSPKEREIARRLAMENFESRGVPMYANNLVYPDIVASMVAKKWGVDAIIPVNTYSNTGPREIMLLADKIYKNKIMRTK